MNQSGWTEIQRCYKQYFKAELSTWQLRLFYFGERRAHYKDPELSKKTIERMAHRQHVEREVAPWDVVIRLAFLYIYQQAKKKKLDWNGKFTYDKLNRLIYATIWGEFRRTRPVHINGTCKHLPTFWAWAIDNKNKFDPVIAQSGLKKMDRFIKDTLTNIMKQRGMS